MKALLNLKRSVKQAHVIKIIFVHIKCTENIYGAASESTTCKCIVSTENHPEEIMSANSSNILLTHH